MEKNKMKEEYNILSQKLNKVITLIEEIKPNWPKMDNIVDTYNNKINDIEENLNKHSISLWSDNFELGKAIDYDLKEKMSSGLHNIIILTAKTIKISEENITKASKKRKIKGIRKSSYDLKTANNYIENYDINENIYETAIVYLKNINEKEDTNQVILSLNQINENLKDLGYNIQLNEEQMIKILNPNIRQTTNIKKRQRTRTYMR